MNPLLIVSGALALLVAYGLSHDIRRAWDAWQWDRDMKRLARGFKEWHDIEQSWSLPAFEPERTIR